MATSYNVDNFTPDVVPRVFKKDVAQLIAQAVSLGWTFMVKADNTATLIAPPPNQHQDIHLSARRNSGPLRRLGAKIMKYADPELLEKVTVPDKVESVEPPAVEPAEVGEPVVINRTYSEGPMMSMGAGNETYESEIATERHWSDGTVTYHCVRCDFQGKAPKSMASHWKKHTPSRPAPPRATPVDSLAAALTKRMEAGLDWSDLHEAAHELAVTATEWGVVRVEAETKRNSEDTDLLNQIRSLVGVSVVDQQEVEDLRRKVRTLTIQLEAERAETEHAVETLKAARDLFNEVAS